VRLKKEPFSGGGAARFCPAPALHDASGSASGWRSGTAAAISGLQLEGKKVYDEPLF